MLKTLVFAAALTAFVGCGTPATDPASEGVWGRTALVEELRIGVDVGAEEYMLGSVEDLAVAPGGTIYVSDSRPVSIRAFDKQGNFLRVVGREGQGPGEYRYAPRLDVLSDDTLVVWAYSNRQISLFSDSGDYLSGFAAAHGGSLYVDDADHIYVLGTGGAAFETSRNRELAKYSRDGQLLGSVRLPPEDRNIPGTFVLSAEGMIYSFPVETHATFSPRGYVVAGRNDAYEIELRDPEGTRRIGREVARAAVQADEWNEWEAFRQTIVQRRVTRESEYEVDPIPEVKPVFREIHAGQDGRVWVFRYVDAEKRDDVAPLLDRPERPLLTWREPWTYDVFEPDGRFLGSVVVPETFRPFVFRGEQIWGALVGTDGVDRVLQLRVVPEG